MQPIVKVEVETSAMDAKDASASAHAGNVPSEDNLLELPPAKAVLARFPMKSLVLYTYTMCGSVVVSKGTVEAVYVDLSPEKSSRDYFYKVALGREKTSIIAGEKQLQYAPKCPVWMKPRQGCSDDEWKCAVVVGSYQEMANAEPQYSVELVEPGTGLFHGVTSGKLRYRAVAAPSTIKKEAGSATVPQASPVAANLENRFDNAFVSPASGSQQVPLKRPDPLRQVSDAHEVASSLRTEQNPSATASPGQQTSPPKATVIPACSPMQADQSPLAALTSAAPLVNAGTTSNEQKDAPASTSETTTPSGKRSFPPEQYSRINPYQQEPLRKMAKVVHPSPSIESGSSHGGLTSEMLLQNSANASEERIEKRLQISQPPAAVGDVSIRMPLTSSHTLQSKMGSVDPYVDGAGVISAGEVEHDQGDVRTLTIKIPPFADRYNVRGKNLLLTRPVLGFRSLYLTRFDTYAIEAIIGERGQNHKRLLRETGCRRIRLQGHNVQNGPNAKPMEVTLTADSSIIQSAQQMLEDVIVSTVSPDQRCRMLYYLAEENDYGSSEGMARFQRSPDDPSRWCWMQVVELPPGFENCTGLFVDVKGKGIIEIQRATGCRCIYLSKTLPKHVYFYSEDLDAVNAAAEAVRARVHWCLDEHQRRTRRW